MSSGPNYTDAGNALRLIERHGGKLRYVQAWNSWMIWDEKRWSHDETYRVQELAKETITAMFGELADMPYDKHPAHAGHAMRSESLSRIRAMIELAKSDPRIAAKPADFDKDIYLLTVANGTLDLRTQELRQHRPEDMITKLAPRAYDPAARSEDFEHFLNDIMEDDQEKIAFLQRALGYTLSGDVSKEKAFFIAWGTGQNGKSTLFNAVSSVMGDYAKSTQAQTLMKREHSGGPTSELAVLTNARLVTVSETDSGMEINAGLVKQITGGDPLTARLNYKDPITFKPQMKIWLMTNNPPEVRDTSNGIWSRIKYISFNADFRGREDHQMEQKLNDAGEAILAWAVEGYRQYQLQGLNIPASVLAATQAYREEQDVLQEFIEEKCVRGNDLEARSSELYSAYQEWAGRSHNKVLTTKEFSNQMIHHGFTKVRNNGMRYKGIGLPSTRDNLRALPSVSPAAARAVGEVDVMF